MGEVVKATLQRRVPTRLVYDTRLELLAIDSIWNNFVITRLQMLGSDHNSSLTTFKSIKITRRYFFIPHPFLMALLFAQVSYHAILVPNLRQEDGLSKLLD